MRPLRTAAALLVLVLVLSACGGSEPAPAAPGTPGTAFPVVLESVFGTTEVPAAPERVVVLGLTDADAVLALGVEPVALQQWLPQFDRYGVGPWAQDLVAEAVDAGRTQVLGGDGPVSYDVEQVASLRPDLVVAVSANLDQATFDRLSTLAPVVARPPGTVNFGVPRQDSTMLIGRALGRADQAAALVAETDRRYTEAAAAHPELAGRTVALTRPTEGGWSAWLAADGRSRITASLGLVQPPALAAVDDGAFATTLSAERLDLLEADALVVIEPEGYEGAVAADPVISGLDVVRRGDVVVLDAAGVGGALAYDTVLSARTVVEQVVPQLADVLAG